MIPIKAFPNLLFDKKIFDNLNDLSPDDKTQVLTTLKTFTLYITTKSSEVLSIEPLQPKSKYAPIMELKTKLDGLEHRFLYVKIPKKHSDRTNGQYQYAMLHSFIKKTSKISDKDKETALRIKKREGY